MASIACFVSAHGFGHGTRTTAVLEYLRDLLPSLELTIISAVPRRLFADTLSDVVHHPLDVDVGLIQHTALVVDYPATINKLDTFLPYSRSISAHLISLCRGCSLILCDISPWGVLVAEELGIPSVLLENFTWDIIYGPAEKQFPKLAQHGAYLRMVSERASYRIQTEPICNPCHSDLTCGPIFRRQRTDRATIREKLGHGFSKIVVITLGGFTQSIPSLPYHQHPDLLFVFPGQKTTEKFGNNLLLLGKEGGPYHPDLLAAADLVVCKSGYSTLAECCQAGVRPITIGREDFPESVVLQGYAREHLDGVAISPSAFLAGEWLELAAKMTTVTPPPPFRVNGAEKVAEFLYNLL
jgi:hypothetical protein